MSVFRRIGGLRFVLGLLEKVNCRDMTCNSLSHSRRAVVISSTRFLIKSFHEMYSSAMFLITNLMASNNSRNVDKGFSP